MRFINRFINSQLRFFSHTDVNVTHTIRCLDMEQSSFNLHVPSHHCCTSSPLKDWRKYHRTFTEIVDQNVDSKTPLKDEESDPNSEFDRRDKEEGHETSQIDAPERNLEEQYRQTSQTDDYDRKLQEKYKEYERRHREWDQYTDKDPNFKRYPAQPTSIDYLPPPPVRNPDQPENIEYAPPPKGYPYSAKHPKPPASSGGPAATGSMARIVIRRSSGSTAWEKSRRTNAASGLTPITRRSLPPRTTAPPRWNTFWWAWQAVLLQVLPLSPSIETYSFTQCRPR